MFGNLGTGELILIVIILTVLFGGKKLPELARGIGEASREFCKALEGEPEKTTPKVAKKSTTKTKQEAA